MGSRESKNPRSDSLPQDSPLYAFDASWVLERCAPLAGADEAGRGALAGPLVAAAVILGTEEIPGITDSKAIAVKPREEMYETVIRNSRAFSMVSFPAWWIDEFGVGEANKQALRRALSSLEDVSGCSLADGNLKLGENIECLPRADARSAAVAAASIIAKVLRDAAMHSLSEAHTGYGFEQNRGYGTPAHRLALSELGPCGIHRLSYAGVGT